MCESETVVIGTSHLYLPSNLLIHWTPNNYILGILICRYLSEGWLRFLDGLEPGRSFLDMTDWLAGIEVMLQVSLVVSIR